MRKKSLAVLLVLAMLLGLFPAAALAEEPEAEGEVQAVETVGAETIAVDTSDADLPSNDELFAEYVQRLLYPQYGAGALGNFGGDTPLTGLDKKIYDGLKEKITQVANGGLASASFTLTWAELEITKTSWTKEELGNIEIVSSGKITSAAINAVMEKIGYTPSEMPDLVNLLLFNCPYDFYWFDKTSGYTYPSSVTVSGNDNSIQLTGEGLTFTFKVSKDYSADDTQGTTDVDTTKTGAAAKAVENANQIITNNTGKSDYEKLKAYKEWICNAVSYDHNSADNKDTPYGDPWQIIYVFDGKEDTNVVCEGYAKAFQYLCDQSDFSDGTVCYTVSGTMTGGTGAGAHMWNIVTLGGQNYLVDVTNCDEGTVGYPDKLFLAGTSGSVTGGYTFIFDGQTVTYKYYNGETAGTPDIIGMYGDRLALADSDYPLPALSLSYTAPDSLTIGTEIAVMEPTVSNGSGSYTFAVKDGSSALPDGLELDTSSGTISGTPTTYSASSVQVTITVTDTGDNDTAECTITFPAVSKKTNTVTFTDPAGQFVKGQQVSFTATAVSDGEITYEYKTKDAEDSTYTTVVPTEVGSYTVRAMAAEDDTWQSAFATHNFSIVAKAVKSIAVTTEPTQKIYVVGQELVTAGMVVTATYNDNSTDVITDGYTVSPTTLNTAGKQTITVTHTASGATATFQVTVAEKVLTGITVETEGSFQTTYQAFDTLNTAGLTVKANYNDGTEKPVTDYAVQYLTGKCLHAGDETVTISYQGKTAQVTDLTVNKIPITIDELAWKEPTTFSYDGKAHTVGLNLREDILELVDVTYSENCTAIYVGDYSVSATIELRDENNYDMNKGMPEIRSEGSWSITAVSDPAVVTTSASLKKGSNTLDLNTLVSGNEGAVSFAFADADSANGCTLNDDGILTSGSETGEVTITATIANKDVNGDSKPEYNGKTATITVTITEKDSKTLAVSQPGWTYGDTETPDLVYTTPDGTTSTTVVYSGANSPDKPTNAGDYTVTVTCETADTIYTGTADFTIAPKDISGAEIALSKTSIEYSGNSQTVTVQSVSLDGQTLTMSNDYHVQGGTSGTNVGTYTAKISGNGNYTGTATKTWNITAKAISIASASATDRDYIPNDKSVTISEVTFNGAALTKGTDYTVTGTMADANAGTGKTVNVTVTLKNSNYTLAADTTTTTVTISKAAYSGQTTVTGTIWAGQSGSVTLPALPDGATAAIKGSAPTEVESAAISNGTLTYTGGAGVTNGAEYKVTIAVTNATNYNDYEITVTLTGTAKVAPTLTVNPITVTYNGQPIPASAITGTAKVDGTEVSGTWSWSTGNNKVPTDVADSGKDFYVTFTPADGTRYTSATAQVAVTINKATPTGAPKYTAISTSGKTLADAGLTTVGGTFSVPGTVAWELDETTAVQANTSYKWIFTPDSSNYEQLTGTIQLWHRSSSGSSSSSSSSGSTTTDRNPDGSTTTTTSSNGTVTETTKYPDGSKEVVETKKDGTVTTTTTDKAGNETKVVENPNGSSETTVSNTDGSSGTTTVSRSGQVESNVKLSLSAVENAADKGEAAALPMPAVPVTTSRTDAPTVTVDLPAGRSALVEIPVENVTPGTVAILVNADGSETVLKTSMVTDGGVTAALSDGDTVRIVDNSKTFSDVSNFYWAADAIDFATSRELLSGTGAAAFSPAGTTNRQQVWMILARLDGADPANMAEAKSWAVENGISDGTNPTGAVTRQQLVSLLYRYAVQNGYDVSNKADLSGYPDAASVASYAAEPMAWAVANGIIGGTTQGTLNPAGDSNRAQLAVILWRFCQTTAG